MTDVAAIRSMIGEIPNSVMLETSRVFFPEPALDFILESMGARHLSNSNYEVKLAFALSAILDESRLIGRTPSILEVYSKSVYSKFSNNNTTLINFVASEMGVPEDVLAEIFEISRDMDHRNDILAAFLVDVARKEMDEDMSDSDIFKLLMARSFMSKFDIDLERVHSVVEDNDILKNLVNLINEQAEAA